MRLVDHYYILGIQPKASAAEIKAAYRRAALTHHPDRGGDDGAMKRINAAYEVVGDPDRRAAYDRELARAWEAAQGWAEDANRMAAQPSTPPPRPPWATGKWPTQTTRRPPRPAPAPWRHWVVRSVGWAGVAGYGYLIYSAALAGPWGWVALALGSWWYAMAAWWVYDVADDLFLR